MADDVVDREYEEELRQFLEADLLPEAGDPAFKARLRGHLLALLRAQRGDEAGPSGNGADAAPLSGVSERGRPHAAVRRGPGAER